jgi:hypothetical protein
MKRIDQFPKGDKRRQEMSEAFYSKGPGAPRDECSNVNYGDWCEEMAANIALQGRKAAVRRVCDYADEFGKPTIERCAVYAESIPGFAGELLSEEE